MSKLKAKYMDDYNKNRNYDDTVETYNQRQEDMSKARAKRKAAASAKVKSKLGKRSVKKIPKAGLFSKMPL